MKRRSRGFFKALFFGSHQSLHNRVHNSIISSTLDGVDDAEVDTHNIHEGRKERWRIGARKEMERKYRAKHNLV